MTEENKSIVPWEEQLAQYAQEVAALERPSVTRISLKGAAITVGDITLEDNYMDLVVFGSMFEKRMYAGKYNPDKPAAPVCFSFSDTGDGMRPHEKAYQPQSEDCASCPNNQWGTAGEGRRGKACKDSRKLALLPAADVVSPEKILKAEVAIVDIPVTSVPNWRNYVNACLTIYKRPYWALVTRMTVKPHPKTQIAVSFQTVALVEKECIDAMHARTEGAMHILAVPYEYNEDGSLSTQTEAMMTGRKY